MKNFIAILCATLLLSSIIWSDNWSSISSEVNHADLTIDIEVGKQVLLNPNCENQSTYEMISLIRLRMHISAKLNDQKKFYEDYILLQSLINFIDLDLHKWAND